MALDAIRDQVEAVTLLRRAIASERVAHAYAFVGPEGSGRKATALAFASALVAPQGGPAAARVERGSHPDVHRLGPTPPSNPEKGTPALRTRDPSGRWSVGGPRPSRRLEGRLEGLHRVDEAEKMTASTPQALLKTLEEPRAGP